MLEAQAETAFPAGNNNPTVVCCHGISTKMLFLSRSSQQNGVAYVAVDLTLCFFLPIVVVFIQGTVGFVKKYTWSLALVGEFVIMVPYSFGKFS